MNANTTYSPADQFAAALNWWRDAGVDWCFADSPHNWLAPLETQAQAASSALPAPDATQRSAPPSPADTPPAPASRLPEPASWPQNLDAYADWWLHEPSLDTGGPYPRIAPRLCGADALMAIIVPVPEAEDRDTLLSGPQGRLLGAMLAAMGLAADAVHVTSVLPRHTPHADWTATQANMMGTVLRHQMGLVRPQRVMVFGAAILPLLGHDPAQNPADFRQFPLDGGMMPALAALDLKTLLERPRLRARFWQRWLEWTDGVT